MVILGYVYSVSNRVLLRFPNGNTSLILFIVRREFHIHQTFFDFLCHLHAVVVEPKTAPICHYKVSEIWYFPYPLLRVQNRTDSSVALCKQIGDPLLFLCMAQRDPIQCKHRPVNCNQMCSYWIVPEIKSLDKKTENPQIHCFPGISSSSQGFLFPPVPTARTVRGHVTFENLYLPPCSRSYSMTFEDKETPDGRASQGQK